MSARDQEMVFGAHDWAFAFFKAACTRGLHNNLKAAVDAISAGRERAYNRRFLQMCSHYLVDPVACTPALTTTDTRCRRTRYQISIAELPLAEDIGDFRFDGAEINETLVRDLAGGEFLAHQRNVVLAGGTGTDTSTGKAMYRRIDPLLEMFVRFSCPDSGL